jgi:hypothetical protein
MEVRRPGSGAGPVRRWTLLPPKQDEFLPTRWDEIGDWSAGALA